MAKPRGLGDATRGLRLRQRHADRRTSKLVSARHQHLNAPLAADEVAPLAVLAGLMLWLLRLSLAPTSTPAMVLADVIATDDVHAGHRLWSHIESWAAELGPTAPNALAQAGRVSSEKESTVPEDPEADGA